MRISRFRSSVILVSSGLLGMFSSLSPGLGVLSRPDNKPAGISKEASDSCGLKVKRLEEYTAKPDPKEKQTTQFSQSELNSFLALELSRQYHPSLKSLLVALEEDRLQGVATIDFDVLGMNSKSVAAKLFTKLFAGVHNLTVRGKLLARDGKGSFQLEEARFDDTTLPNFLVEEIISAVGKKQKPPFDPMQPNTMPYNIERVDLHREYILVYQ